MWSWLPVPSTVALLKGILVSNFGYFFDILEFVSLITEFALNESE